MIRTIIIMSSSGRVLFSKECMNSVKNARMVGGLLVTMLEFSMITAGMHVSYIELTNIGVTIVWNQLAKVWCALFMDKDDGAEFGKLLATEILRGFQDDYANVNSLVQQLVDFSKFDEKLADIIQSAAQPVLNTLVRAHGIEKAVLVTENSHIFQTADTDRLGLLANLQALAGLSTDIMAHCGDSVHTVALEGNPRSNSRVQIRRVEQSTLVVTAQRRIRPSEYESAIETAIDMLHRLAQVVSILHAHVH